MKVILCFLCFVFLGQCFGQDVAGYLPENPKDGEDITIWYNPHVDRALFKEGEEVHCAITVLYAENFESSRDLIPMTIDQDKFQCSYRIPGKAMTLFVYFITVSSGGLDRFSLLIDVMAKDRGDKKTAAYPGYAFRDKWFNYPFLFSADSVTIKIREEMKLLEPFRKKDQVGTLYSESYGNILTGEEDKARELIREMLERYPSHQLTFQAMDSYCYSVVAGKIESDEGAHEIDSLMTCMVTRFPKKQFSQLYLNSHDASSLQTRTIEKICRRWLHKEPDNPLAIIRLVDRYNRDQVKARKTIRMCDKGVKLIAQNKLRKHMDYKGSLGRRYSAYLYTIKASALLNSGEPIDALHAIQAANGYQPQNHKQLLVEGEIWMKLHNYSEAEKVLLSSMKLGGSDAKYLLKRIFEFSDQNGTSFEAYLSRKLGSGENSSISFDAVLKDLTVTTIDKQALNLSEMRGKVVVINFWNLGCGPCRAEIPELNRLVEKYKSSGVVFIAISNDRQDRIEEFLQKKDFNYLQVADANRIFKDYDVKVLPTHLVIDKNGTLHNRMIGGGKSIYEILDNQLKILTSNINL